MKILIVDNYTIHLKELQILLTEHFVSVVHVNDFSSSDAEKFDVVVLSGGSKFSVNGLHKEIYDREIEFIQTTQKPVIGICLGFQLIAKAFGSKIERLPEKVKGIFEIQIIKQISVFDSINELVVYEGHRFVVSKLAEVLEPLAQSTKGCELFQHCDKSIFGMLFHPEVETEKTNGAVVLKNILKKFY